MILYKSSLLIDWSWLWQWAFCSTFSKSSSKVREFWKPLVVATIFKFKASKNLRASSCNENTSIVPYEACNPFYPRQHVTTWFNLIFIFVTAVKRGKKKRNLIIVRPDEDERNSQAIREHEQVRGTQRSEISRVKNQGKHWKKTSQISGTIILIIIL